MNWFDTAGIANLAKSALNTAQKTIDKALDIQEDSHASKKSQNKKTDAENFFEAYGLSDKGSQAKAKLSSKQSLSLEKNVSSEGSGFWTDTWGSFFELKSQAAIKNTSKPSDKDTDHKNKALKDNAVLSQPHRANLFPDETHPTCDKISPWDEPQMCVESISIEHRELSSENEYSKLENKNSSHDIKLEGNKTLTQDVKSEENKTSIQDVKLEKNKTLTQDIKLEEENTPSQDVKLEENNTPFQNVKLEENNTPSQDVKLEESNTLFQDVKLEEKNIPSQDVKLEENIIPSQDVKLEENIIPSKDIKLEDNIIPSQDVKLEENIIPSQDGKLEDKADVLESTSLIEQPLKELPISRNNDDVTLKDIEKVPNNENLKDLPEESTSEKIVCDTLPYIEIDNSESTLIIDTSNANLSPTLPSSQPFNSNQNEGEFSSFDLPLTSTKKVESEYDIIEINKSFINNENSNIDSFPQSTLNKNKDERLFYDDISVKKASDFLSNPDNSIGNWEWGSMGKLPSTLEKSNENQNINISENVLSHSKVNVLIQNQEESLNQIDLIPFNENSNWNQNKALSHCTDESQNSSNEEQNSHHSDNSSNSSKDDDDTDVAKEYDSKSSSSSGSNASSSSSFVKYSNEEADHCPHRGQSPASTTASERSDATKHELSGDEIETATSSDIEILSPPNGENCDRNASPLKHIWLTRPLRFRRSESPTSDSSKDSLMPVVNETEENKDENNSLLSDYYEKGKLRHHKRDDSSEDGSMDRLSQRCDELQSLLEVREKKVLELSKENIELQENEQRLKNLVQKLREEQVKESRDIATLTKDFSYRLSQLEEQLRNAVKERDSLQIQLDESKKEVALRISPSDIEEVINEKDQQIKELTEEGQKLSKKELHHTTIIKKLRAKEEDMEKTIKSQIDKLEENTKEVERLRKSISAKEEQEKKHIDAIRNLTNSVKKLEKEIAMLKSNLEDSKEKELSLKKSLDSTYKDLKELKKSYAAKEKEVEDLKSDLESEAKENLSQMLENSKREALREKEMLLMQMQELRCSLSRSEDEANLREKMFKADISSLQKRLQEAEERNEELTKNMSSATRPMVRQLENLQVTYNAQIASWEKLEKNLIDRLNDAQNQVALANEKERAATEKYLEFHSKLAAYESQNSTLCQEKIQLTTELESLRAKIIMLEENRTRETSTLDNIKQNFNSEITKLKKEKDNIESLMNTCLEQLENEKKKVLRLEEEIRLKDARAMIISNDSPCPSPTASLRSSVSSIHNWSQDEMPDRGNVTPINSYRMSVYDSLRLGSGSSLIENLQSQLKQREGEIIQLQSEISKLEQIKESMTLELVELSEQNETLEKKMTDLKFIEKEHKDVYQKYNTLLQMYGEKVEENEELQMDLADVKTMYKAQIEELLQNK